MKNILFTREDKGNVTVALNRNFYIGKMVKLLSDTDTYTKIKKNHLKNIEKTLNSSLKVGGRYRLVVRWKIHQ